MEREEMEGEEERRRKGIYCGYCTTGLEQCSIIELKSTFVNPNHQLMIFNSIEFQEAKEGQKETRRKEEEEDEELEGVIVFQLEWKEEKEWKQVKDQLKSLKTFQKISIFVGLSIGLNWNEKQQDSLQLIQSLASPSNLQFNWNHSISLWKSMINKDHIETFRVACNRKFGTVLNKTRSTQLPTFPIPDEDIITNAKEVCVRKPRTICHLRHNFKSVEAAGALGESLINRFHWKVDLKNASLVVELYILDSNALISLSAFELDQRNRGPSIKENFSPLTALNPSTSAALVLLALQCCKNNEANDQSSSKVILDPCCGIGTISFTLLF
eukprot:TRINITY_DN8187_c0_g1_i3.p1 TRINITY_DN8187_c0_g1~~TRINITY_DN8187_c0_g1_i3.p1  ORF type:complete len:327 (-),score=89.62 TRINITY_DN8187_c0_g1_i3:49-1029(-)